MTIPFATVGYNTSDIQQIKLSDGGAGGIGWGGEIFSVWEGLPTVAEGSEYLYYDPSMDPNGEETDYYWSDAAGTKASFSVAPGQGVVVNCAADLTSTTAGEVPTGNVEFVSIADNNFTGNPYPAPLSIQSIKISDGDAGGIGWGGEIFSVWEGLPTVAEGSEYLYYDPSMDPNGEQTDYYWSDAAGNASSYTIPSGQGVVINCAAGLDITITPPYSL